MNRNCLLKLFHTTLFLPLLFIYSHQLYAASVTVSCPDLEDPQQCSVTQTGTDNPSNAFDFEYIASLVENVNTCRTDETAESATCNSGELGSFTCALNSDSVSCVLPDESTIDCNYDDEAQSATCTLSSDAAIQNAASLIASLTQAIPEQNIYTSIVNTCTSRTGSSEFQSDCDLLSTANNEELANAIAQITPTTTAAALDSIQATLDAQNRNLTARLEMLRKMIQQKDSIDQKQSANKKITPPAEAPNENNVGKPQNHEPDTPSTENTPLPNLDAKPSGGGASADFDAALLEESRLSTYAISTTLSGDKNQSLQEVGSDWNTVAITLGSDYRFSNKVVAGVAFGLTNTDTDMDNNRGELKNESYNFTGYGSFYLNDAIYFDTTFTYVGSQLEQDRNIQYSIGSTNINQTATARYFSRQYELSIGGGYEWIQTAWNINSFTQLSHREIDIDGYDEDMSAPNGNGASWALAVSQQDINSLQLSLGTQASYAFSNPWGLIMPVARIELKKELNDDPRAVTVQFIDDLVLQQNINIDFNEVDTSYVQIGLGVSAVLTGGHFGYAFWQSTQSLDELDQNTLTLGWRWEI